MKRNLLVALLVVVTSISFAQLTPESLLLFMAFEDGLADSSAKNVVVEQIYGAPITYTTGKFGKAVVFDSTYVRTGDNLEFNPVNDFTMACWYYVSEISTEKGDAHTLVHQKDSAGMNDGRIHLEILDTDVFASFTSGTRNQDVTKVTKDTWYHVANVKSTTANMKYLYVNGVKVAEKAIGAESNTGQLVIGGRKQETDEYRALGYMDDLFISTNVLTEAEINSVMENGVSAVLHGGGGTSVDEISSTQLSITHFANQIFRINNLNGQFAQFNVYSLSGQLVHSGEVNGINTFSLANLTKGLYIVSVQVGSEKIHEKILVK